MREKVFRLNGVDYHLPERPVVVVCIDGGDPAYFDRGIEDGILPNVARFMRSGFSALAKGTMPSFTCPNNMSIVTGAEPAVHGISGNFYLDCTTGEAVVMTGPELLRSETVLGEFSRCDVKVAAITAKDKLRRQLGKNMNIAGGSICFSSECADQCTKEEHGIDDALGFVGAPLPHMYSQELSLFVLDAGIRLLEQDPPMVTYLSLTDYIQHKYAPGEAEANLFYQRIDERFGRLKDLGAVVALIADHGMNDKSNPDGSPKVVWLQDILDAEFGLGATTVICPITDRFVAHHGSLGGFVRVYCHEDIRLAAVMEAVLGLPGIESVYDKHSAARIFELPVDREGDLAVLADINTSIGAAEKDHDLSGLKGHRLRTHGSVAESWVPFILSDPLIDLYAARAEKDRLRSHNIFDFAINGVEAHTTI